MNTQFRFAPYSAEFGDDPYTTYAKMRETCPIYYHAAWDTWLLSRYQDIRSLITDKRLGRTMDHVMTDGQVAAYRRRHQWDEAPRHSRYVKRSILDSEGALHERLRSAVFRMFTAKRIGQLRHFIQRRVEDGIAAVAGRGEFDFIDDFVAPIPGDVIGEMLGVPEFERPQLRLWSEDIVQFFEPERTAIHRQLAERATAEFVEFLHGLLALRAGRPKDDVLSEMISWRDESGRGLDQDELISTVMTILMAGHGSTIDAAGNGMLALLQHRRQLAMLRDDPGLIDTAVQEMFRFEPPLPYFHRYTLEDMEYNGYAFRKGTKLGFLYASANRDEGQFEQADRFNIKRNPNRHLAFGGGAHHCLGNHLARQNMEIVFTTMLKKLPTLALAMEEERLEYRPGIQSRGLLRLPLSC